MLATADFDHKSRMKSSKVGMRRLYLCPHGYQPSACSICGKSMLSRNMDMLIILAKSRRRKTMFDFLLVAGVAVFCYAHYKLHLSLAQIKADLLAELAKVKALFSK
jgi:hypothetical protein